MILEKSNKVSIAWIGVGGYGKRLWKSITELSNCNVTACFHPKKPILEQAALDMQCRGFDDYDELLDETSINAVVLAIPNEFHFDYTLKALNKGKHVLVEKPITNHSSEAEVLIKTAFEKSLVLMVGHDYRKNGYILKIKDELEAGSLGRIVAAEFNMGHGGGLKFNSSQWRFYGEKCPGGPLNMLGTHMIDVANYLFGEAEFVNGTVKNLCCKSKAEDMSLIQISYKNGIVVNITNLYNSVDTEFINIYGTKGAVHFLKQPEEGLWFQGEDIDCKPAKYKRLCFDNINTSIAIFEDFVSAVLKNRFSSTNSIEALRTVKIMEAAIKSYNQKCLIKINS
jgi:UDP-N-acetylglucosamine 3-dehydrogenase